MKLKDINDDVFTRGLKKAKDSLPEGIGAQLYWNQNTRQAYLSVGDWADPDDVIEAKKIVAKAVGINNVWVEYESGPNTKEVGWYEVSDNKLKPIKEGVVAAARDDIINVINDAATQIAEAVQEMGFPKPVVEFTDDGTTPAVLNIQAGQNDLFQEKQTIAVAVHGDSEFKMELPAGFATALNLSDFYPQRSADEVVERLQEIRASMRELHHERAGVM